VRRWWWSFLVKIEGDPLNTEEPEANMFDNPVEVLAYSQIGLQD